MWPEVNKEQFSSEFKSGQQVSNNKYIKGSLEENV